MKEENAKPKKKVLSYIILAVCVLLLAAATVLTVYFLTTGAEPVLETPPPSGPSDQDKPGPSGSQEPNEPDEPTGGEDTVAFVSPIEGATYTVEYNIIYKNETLGWIYRHKAVDFDAAAGTEVRCMADGVVESISLSQETGNLITIDHGDGLKTVYRFVEPSETLKEGATVKKGQTLGVVAAAYGIERADGEHLHLEIKLGKDSVDPTDYLDPVLQEK